MIAKKQIRKEQIQQLVNQGYEAKEIAKMLSIPTSTLRQGIKQLNINLRKRPRVLVEFVKDQIQIEYPKEGTIVNPREVINRRKRFSR